ncbi:hypothetical protein AC01_1367 [Escherichia coli 1-392-07_S3_C1]|nr:hypothetical protein AC57_3557 [Escherichia coli 1-392-07_S3_C3]KDT34837.1 hypothetical protein AB17_1945 [Escherichia coli 3-105-05_S1_C1]KDU56972.1 hypothetical protein AD18_2357 [Escherichia coli 3-475-03_S4_C2]KDW61476.1 hypothetical protein AC29_1683 [Escherichia coli 1-392-07_S3_C2]KDX04923.1 hypothetical protein AC01_1367 [Escherichia coli 1-392-07_S3_C1]
MDSMTTGKDSGGQSGVKYTLNGGGYISQTTGDAANLLI